MLLVKSYLVLLVHARCLFVVVCEGLDKVQSGTVYLIINNAPLSHDVKLQFV